MCIYNILLLHIYYYIYQVNENNIIINIMYMKYLTYNSIHNFPFTEITYIVKDKHIHTHTFIFL